MTKFTTPVLLLFLSFFTSDICSQEIDCVRSATLSGNMNYINTGTAYLERFDDGRLQLRLSEDFEATDINTDVRMYLSNNPTNVTGAALLFSLDDINGGRHYSGAITIDVSDDISIEDYTYVVTWCERFRALWGNGEWSEPSCDTGDGGNGEEPDTTVQCLESATATTDWASEITICTDDGIADPVELRTTIDVRLGENYSFVITNVNGTIQDVVNANSFDFDGTSQESQLVYGVYYRGDLSYQLGQNISEMTADSCLQLSSEANFLRVNKESCVEIFDCVETTVATTNWVDELTICPSDGMSDIIPFINNMGQEPGVHYAYVITDDAEDIIAVITDDSSYDFEGSGDGPSRVYGLSFAGDLDFTIGANRSTITADSCLILSDSERFLTVFKDGCAMEPTTRMITGQIVSPGGDALSNVRIEYGDKQSVMTDAQGRYIIEEVPNDASIELVPINNQNAGNGLSSLDLVLVTRHILGLDPFSDPFQLIAADANNSGSISASDLVAMQRVLLSQSPDFVGQSSWVFIPEDTEITTSILRDGVPTSLTIPVGSDDVTEVNFIGIKVGDLNGSASNQ